MSKELDVMRAAAKGRNDLARRAAAAKTASAGGKAAPTGNLKALRAEAKTRNDAARAATRAKAGEAKKTSGRLPKSQRPPSRPAKNARIAKAGFAKDTPSVMKNYGVGAGGTGH